MDPQQDRKSIRLPRDASAEAGRIFSITLCTAGRAPLFGTPAYASPVFHEATSGPLTERTNCMVVCLMPDHLHLLVAPRAFNLIDELARWKAYTTHLLRQQGLQGRLWQRSFYDRALRLEDDLTAAAQYIIENPVRAGLVARWQDYPYSWNRWVERE